MPPPQPPMPEGHGPSTRLRDLGLRIDDTQLQPIIDEFRRELDRTGICRVKPHFYLSTEWGVPFDTVAIAIPFYLARPDLTQMHAERAGFVEGVGRADILRYLRHEMGHVVNYAYKLYDEPEWVKHFGSITQPYEEEYRPVPFSRRFVRHLPGFYAQKHPDEDWAETFAVWMTPGRNWRAEYAGWPTALAKLEYCDRRMKELGDQPPLVEDIELDEDVGALSTTLEEYYGHPTAEVAMPPGLDGALQAIFEDVGAPEGGTSDAPRKSAAELIHRLRNELAAVVFRWTGHFPERTRPLLAYLAKRAEELHQVYPADREERVVIALTSLVTALAMNHVVRGSYFA
ncbi:MAG TPA: hypothetical protein VL371_01270 [Gemmataceae bacterium]|jgi:hypothetical protein|nr:hypothetical protein [Gemmataceae bacterium]